MERDIMFSYAVGLPALVIKLLESTLLGII